MIATPLPYCGRFAPSPTGSLHLGSLLAAVASYLEARARNGRWLVRIEDVDRTRVQAGAASRILTTLEAYGFEWDGEVVYQTDRDDLYEAALLALRQSGRAYPCACSRREVAEMAVRVGVDGPVYGGRCRGGLPEGVAGRAWRVRVDAGDVGFRDVVQGVRSQDLARDVGDFVVRRADDLFAYQLAVVADDAEQGVTHVVRGADLLDSTPRQIGLIRMLGYAEPEYAHVPILVNERGEKLSKQTLAPALDGGAVVADLMRVLRYLGQNPPSDLVGVSAVWSWACQNWCLERVPRQLSIAV
ncbi:tRNA glutamyl-Q(34) synthetase GluQRS [Chitinibacteraceae bacterium HSL-7]